MSHIGEHPGEGDYEIGFDFVINGYNQVVYYDFCPIDYFVNSLMQYACNTLEGKLEIVQEEYRNKYTINGISIDGFINRSNKVRLEIIE